MLLSRFVVSILWLLLIAGVASGQDFASKPIRIVTTGAGGGSDFVARILLPGISGTFGQPVIVDNRGTGMIQAEYLFKTPPDGHGLIITGSTFWMIPLLQKVPYDAATDFSPVALIVREVRVLAVHNSLPVKSVKELIALAKARPGELNYAASAPASPAHLASELFKSMAGVNIVHIPYKGSAAQLTALMGGEVHMSISDASAVMPHVKSGKLRGLAITSAEPSALVPGLPTVAAAGLPGFDSVGMTGMFAPPKTPAAIVNRLNQEVVRLLHQPDVREKLLNGGAEPVGNTPEQFLTYIKTDLARVAKVIKDANIKVD